MVFLEGVSAEDLKGTLKFLLGLLNQEEERYEGKKTASVEQWHFVLKSANHQVIGQSERYNSKQAMENGIAAVAHNAADAPMVEEEASVSLE